MAQQTAVEWFSKEVAELFFQLLHKKITAGEYAVKYMDLVEQAKQMEKKQIEEICLSVIEQILDNLEKGEEVESETIFKKHLERFK